MKKCSLFQGLVQKFLLQQKKSDQVRNSGEGIRYCFKKLRKQKNSKKNQSPKTLKSVKNRSQVGFGH